MTCLIIILVLVAVILIWHEKRIADLEEIIDDQDKLIKDYGFHLESLCHELVADFDDVNDTFDNLFKDIQIIRKHVGLEGEKKKEILLAIEKSLDDIV